MVKIVQVESEKYLKGNVDYGFLGVYQNEKDKLYQIRGMICLGSKPFEDLQKDFESSIELKELNLHKADSGVEEERRKI